MDRFIQGDEKVLEEKWYDLHNGYRMFARVTKAPTPNNVGDPTYYNRTPVVLVPGMVVGGTYMIPLAENLAPYVKVFIIDLPGYGRSNACDKILTFDELIDSMAAFLDAALLTRASFFGNSFGCQLIAAFAAKYPAKIDRCILQGPTVEKSRRNPLSQIYTWLLNGFKENSPTMLPIMFQDYYSAGLRRDWATFRMALEDKIEKNAAKIQCPALVVSGEKDPVAPAGWCETLSKLIPISRHVIIRGSTHTANYVATERLSRVCRPFLIASSVYGNDTKPNEKFSEAQVCTLYENIPQSTDREEVDVSLPNVADFDSASGMLRAVANMLHGKDLNHLGVNPPLLPKIFPLFNYLPEMVRDTIYSYIGSVEACKAEKLVTSPAAEIADRIVEHFPKGIKHPVIAIGSSNGALTHLYSGMGIPWLPQTFLIPVKRPDEVAFTNGHIDLEKEMKWGLDAAKEYLAENRELQLHHMADPNQDGLMVQWMSYFRFKYIALPEAYQKYLLDALAPGGTIVIASCNLDWPVTKVAERHYFQAGAYGGLDAEEYVNGSERIQKFIDENNKHHYESDGKCWNSPKPNTRSVEAEWGFAGSLRLDILEFAREHGFKVKQLSFNQPDDPSPLVADIFRTWYRELNLSGDHLLMSSFIFMDPWQTIRMGLTPFWSPFSVKNSVKNFRKYLKESKEKGDQYTTAHAFLFSHGTPSINIAELDDWRGVLQSSDLLKSPITSDDVFVGVETDKYPKDFACVVNYNPDLRKKVKERYIMPPPMEPGFVLGFLEDKAGNYGVKYSTLL